MNEPPREVAPPNGWILGLDDEQTYEILLDTGEGRAIRCNVCGMTSYNANDVRERYCGRCHVFHELRCRFRPRRPDEV